MDALVPSVHKMHYPPSYHPERPERIEIAIKGMKEEGLEPNIVDPGMRDAEILTIVHERAYIEYIRGRGKGYIDADTYSTEGTFEAALAAASCAVEAADRVAGGEFLSISLARPPGHHAGRSGAAMGCRTLGFCIFNNAAIAAIELVRRGVMPVAILDFDLHHGNGTQEILWYNPEVLHIDIHDAFEYPGTGWPNDLGGGAARGTKVNIPVYPETGDKGYIFMLEDILNFLMEKFRPKAFVISAGFDAYAGEGMGYISLSSRAYWRMGNLLKELGENWGVKGFAVILEGGYSIGLRKGLPSFLKGISGMGGEGVGGELEEGTRQYKIFLQLKEFLSSFNDK